MDIYLIRHAESEGNINGRFNGVTDLPLSENGRKQALLLGSFLSDIQFNKIYTSKLKRAYETAGLSLPEHKGEFIRLGQLNEINGGDWEKVKWTDLPSKWPEQFRNWEEQPELTQMPNGESVAELSERSITIFTKIIKNGNAADSIAIFTHGTVIKALIAHILKLPLSSLRDIAWYENASATKVVFIDNRCIIEFFNEHSHLPVERKTIGNMEWGKEMYRQTKY